MSIYKHQGQDIFTYRPGTAKLRDSAEFHRRYFFLHKQQTLNPDLAATLVGQIPKSIVPSSYPDMVDALAKGLYGEQAHVQGQVLCFLQPIVHEDPAQQKGCIVSTSRDPAHPRGNGYHLVYQGQATIFQYLQHCRAALTTSQERVERGIVLLQGSPEEQQRLAQAIDSACHALQRKFSIADLLYTEEEREWDSKSGSFVLCNHLSTLFAEADAKDLQIYDVALF